MSEPTLTVELLEGDLSRHYSMMAQCLGNSGTQCDGPRRTGIRCPQRLHVHQTLAIQGAWQPRGQRQVSSCLRHQQFRLQDAGEVAKGRRAVDVADARCSRSSVC